MEVAAATAVGMAAVMADLAAATAVRMAAVMADLAAATAVATAVGMAATVEAELDLAVATAAEKAVEAKNLHRRPRFRPIPQKFHF